VYFRLAAQSKENFNRAGVENQAKWWKTLLRAVVNLLNGKTVFSYVQSG
jgi:hypothetical protein